MIPRDRYYNCASLRLSPLASRGGWTIFPTLPSATIARGPGGPNQVAQACPCQAAIYFKCGPINHE